MHFDVVHFISSFSDDTKNEVESRALLYYASPETLVYQIDHSDIYGHLIEKKRVGVRRREDIAVYLCLCFLVFNASLPMQARSIATCASSTSPLLSLLPAPSLVFFARPSKLQRQSSLCHSCRYTRIHHVPSFLTSNASPGVKQDSSFIKTTSSTNLTEPLSSSSLVAACAASTLSSAVATTDHNSDDFIASLSNHRLSTSSLPFSILNGDSGVYGSRISIADDVYEQLCEKPKKSVSRPHSSASSFLLLSASTSTSFSFYPS